MSSGYDDLVHEVSRRFELRRRCRDRAVQIVHWILVALQARGFPPQNVGCLPVNAADDDQLVSPESAFLLFPNDEEIWTLIIVMKVDDSLGNSSTFFMSPEIRFSSSESLHLGFSDNPNFAIIEVGQSLQNNVSLDAYVTEMIRRMLNWGEEGDGVRIIGFSQT